MHLLRNTQFVIQIQFNLKLNKSESYLSQGYLFEQHNFSGTKITYQIDNMSLSLTLERYNARVRINIIMFFS